MCQCTFQHVFFSFLSVFFFFFSFPPILQTFHCTGQAIPLSYWLSCLHLLLQPFGWTVTARLFCSCQSFESFGLLPRCSSLLKLIICLWWKRVRALIKFSSPGLTSYLNSNSKFVSIESILDMRTHFKPTETFQYTFFTMCHPPGAKKGFVKGEALRLLTEQTLQEIISRNI